MPELAFWKDKRLGYNKYNHVEGRIGCFVFASELEIDYYCRSCFVLRYGVHAEGKV